MLAASVAARREAPPLRLEWRPNSSEAKETNPLSHDDVQQAFAQRFGGVRRVAMSCERRPNGRWSATVELESATAAAHAVGCRQILIKERAVTAEPVGAGEAEEGGAQKKQRVE